MLEAYQSALEIGDVDCITFSAYVYTTYSYLIGKNLTALEPEMRSYSEVIVRLKQETTCYYHNLQWQAVLNLIGQAENPCRLSGEAYEEEQILSLHRQTNDKVVLFLLYCNKLILNYLF